MYENVNRHLCCASSKLSIFHVKLFVRFFIFLNPISIDLNLKYWNFYEMDFNKTYEKSLKTVFAGLK